MTTRSYISVVLSQSHRSSGSSASWQLYYWAVDPEVFVIPFASLCLPRHCPYESFPSYGFHVIFFVPPDISDLYITVLWLVLLCFNCLALMRASDDPRKRSDTDQSPRVRLSFTFWRNALMLRKAKLSYPRDLSQPIGFHVHQVKLRRRVIDLME